MDAHRQDQGSVLTIDATRSAIVALNESITSKCKLLLESKHLYQKTTVEGEAIVSRFRERLPAELLFKFDAWWNTHATTLSPTYDRDIYISERAGIRIPALQLKFTNIRLFCEKCDRREIFVPVWFRDEVNELRGPILDTSPSNCPPIPSTFQLFSVLYECQSCNGLPTAMLIRRSGWDFSLDGRSPMEHVEVPSYIPTKEPNWYSDAVTSLNDGKPLAALLYLRTFIEQFARRVTKSPGIGTGSEIMSTYSNTLPAQHRDSMPSLHDWYEKISASLDSGQEDVDLFREAREQIDHHFDIRRVYRIPES